MPYKSLSSAVRFSALVAGPAGRAQHPAVGGARRARRRAVRGHGIATAPILLVLLLLVLPLDAAAVGGTPSLSAAGPAVAGMPLGLSGRDFPPRTSVQFEWDGQPSEFAAVRTANDGTFTTIVVPPVAGRHVITAVASGKGGRKAGSASAASITLDVAQADTAPTPTAAPTATPTPTATPAAPGNGIWFGAFYDQNWRNNSLTFGSMIDDLQSRGLDSAMSVNGFVRFHEPLLSVSDGKRFPIFTSIVQGELNEQWWNRSTWDAAAAESIIGPLVDRIKGHPSVIGYNIKDDAHSNLNEPMRLAQDVFEAHDPARFASPTMVQTLAPQVYAYVDPSVFLYYNYPARDDGKPVCGWADTWLSRLRSDTNGRTDPWFIALQTHDTKFGPTGTTLRYPTVEEVRLQAWLALGEDVDGIWWFHYDDHVDGEWLGFRSQPATYAEITALAGRVTTIEGRLAPLRKAPDAYAASGGYVSTMSGDGATYLVVANKSCTNRDLVVNPGVGLRDVESGVSYAPGQAIPFRGGDGRLLEVVTR